MEGCHRNWTSNGIPIVQLSGETAIAIAALTCGPCDWTGILDYHTRQIQTEVRHFGFMSNKALHLFREAIAKPDEHINLAEAAMLIALEEYPNLEIGEYEAKIDRLANRAARQIDLAAQANPLRKVEEINRVLFAEEGYCGNKENYYDPRNSFLNEVLDRRTGIPITLSVLYMEIGRRLGLKVEGVSMPGHFLTRFLHKGTHIFIDPFNGGELFLEEGCRKRLAETYAGDLTLDQSFLDAVSKSKILLRMLGNLKAIYFGQKDFGRALSVIEKILAVKPDSPTEFRDRGITHFEMNHLSAAVRDWTYYLELSPLADDREAIKSNIGIAGQLIAMKN